MTELLPTGGEFRGQMVWAIVLVALLQKAKRLGWISEQSKGLQQGIAWIGAFLATFGVHFAFAGSLACGGRLTLDLPPMGDLAHGVMNFVLTIGAQEGSYNLARLPELIRGKPGRLTGTERNLQDVIQRVRGMLKKSEA